MIIFLVKFFKAKGDIRWKLLYALDYWKDLENKPFFLCEKLEVGEWGVINRYGNINKYEPNIQ